MPKQRLKIPTDLPADVRREAQKLVRLLGKRVRPGDEYLLSLLASAWINWRSATADVAEQGRVVMSGGTAIANPSLAVATGAATQIVTLARELGLSPAARRKLFSRRKAKPSSDIGELFE
ncbi:MAG: phage terminase small subunit P27 family [Planctomycetaceae bacterium]|nr:phage terminase small subunit P27 family [Planctomycetaceae bacterium]